ncbi:hypothetical protein MUN88_05880 [Gracilibacillus caseinilyticus]|uniref:Lipoprotein n=1 Tax=Gracilibacillus caseinilyticus TaxID=2932256 RepID=A0ABY4EZB5_9BACI|nr:hypothetical protein [Gracilibacillus caseinilyticus]UOQ49609.1 hypothetical protein MUN88_05880 [Gracilibacillus caseinilyticus]
MRKLTFIFIIAICLMACSTQPDVSISASEQPKQTDMREIVWKQLSEEQRQWVNGSWKDAKVSKVTLKSYMVVQSVDPSHFGKEVFVLDFPTKNKSIPNNMIIYADIDTYEYISSGLVD